MFSKTLLRIRKCCRNVFRGCFGRQKRKARGPSPSESTLEDTQSLPGLGKTDVEQQDFSTKDSRGKKMVLFERQDLPETTKPELACISLDLRMSHYLRQVVIEKRRVTPQRVLLQEHNFVAGLDAMLEMYNLSKITPTMDETIESMLIDISMFYWTATLETQRDVSEMEKKLLEEAFGLTLRSLLRQSPTTQQFIFLLKHLDPKSTLFLLAVNQLLYCGKHHPKIDLNEVQQAFPDFPREIWPAGTTAENINEGDLEIEEL